MVKILQGQALALDDVLLVPQHSTVQTRQECDPKVKIGDMYLEVPIFSAAMDTIKPAALSLLGEMGGVPVVHRFNSPQEQVALVKEVRRESFYVAAALGIHDFKLRSALLYQAGVACFFVDVAHADSSPVLSVVDYLRRTYPECNLIVGTVATPDATRRLVDLGVEGVRIGIGTGSACITRTVAGVGIPQFTALTEAFEVAQDFGVAILSDGGVRTPGDFAKAVGAGASACVIGKLFAETTEGSGLPEGTTGNYYGMATKAAAKKVAVQKGSYHIPAEEGTTVSYKVKGTVEKVVNNLVGGLKSAMSYSNARTIDEFHANALFIQQTNAGAMEGNRGIS